MNASRTNRQEQQSPSCSRWLTTGSLRRQNRRFHGTGGVSQENRSEGFQPAFSDIQTGAVYRSRFADGRPAPMQLLDGLPTELIISRCEAGRVTAVKASVEAGFVRAGLFYTREQAARAAAVHKH